MSDNSTKKKTAAAATAVALAAALMIGGTFSYLSAASGEVVNTFSTDTIAVDVTEDGDGQYDIVPGTSESKNPTVTVDAGYDAYVFLIVQDNTLGLVEYTIDDTVWKLLYADEDGDGVNDYETTIYYTTVDAADETQYLNVLYGQTVSYSTDLTNSDMLDASGNLLDNITLSFGAVAIESASFDDVYAAFKAAYASYTGTPLASVTTVDPYEITISYSSSSSDVVGTITPDVIYVFAATESTDTAAYSYYADWVADFVVTFDTSGANADELADWNGYVAVAGQYDTYSENYWIPILLTGVTDGSSYNLLQTLFGYSSGWGGVDYLELCGVIGEFTCGTIQTITLDGYSIDVPDGVKMTVELRLYESYSNQENYVSCGSWTYTFGSDSTD